MSQLSNQLDHYRLLGRSGLRVSPLCLGTMTFGNSWGWGADVDESQRMLDVYADLGGNFIDTANEYTDGESESILGSVLQGRRERFVIATKFGLSRREGDPNGGGAHRKSLKRAVEDSLRRLKTDYIDLYYLHIWDWRTPIEETLGAMNDLVREGKVLYLGMSDAPAWKVAEANTLARMAHWSPFVAYQGRYNLIDRTLERDVLPMSVDHGLQTVTWQALASGILTGKYAKANSTNAPEEGTRSGMVQGAGWLTDRALAIAAEVKSIADEINSTSAEVAIAWVLSRFGRPIPILGARTASQLQENLKAATLTLPEETLSRLSKVSAFELGFPHDFASSEAVAGIIDKGVTVERGPQFDYNRWR
ncbi:aldo/keto reductase [Nodosilinea sp. LEGE 07088]|uniref:aldo/keto reductase n=1 Tax=Nodosilinea sp. LEGE 07088 TaxID=2777968 RepID=UPI001882D15D|nr:aldo/keto reductase [Nodosilinea sp. LEGE 07088]MBE9138226.1 aldo/keto reductase [Nodosilinea sp. LEGE 07088]